MRKMTGTWCMIVLFGSLMVGCSPGETLTLSGEELVEKAVNAGKQNSSYASEGVMTAWVEGKQMETITIKEWVDEESGKRLTEASQQGQVSYGLLDGKEMIIYEQDSDTAYTADIDLMTGGQMDSRKEQVIAQLERLRETHRVETVGEEELLGRSVYHFKAIPETTDSLTGELEYWVDPKSWMVIKNKAIIGDNISEFAYTSIDDSPQFTADTFTLKLPDNVVIQDLNDMNETKIISLEEAKLALGKTVLYHPDGDTKLSHIEQLSTKGEINREEITFYYTKDTTGYINLTVLPIPDEPQTDNLIPGETKVNIRGQEAIYMKMIQSLSWEEDGHRYSLLGESPDLTKEKLFAWASELVPAE